MRRHHAQSFGRRAPADSDSDLIDIIRQVRRRWRMKLALRGAASWRRSRWSCSWLAASASSRRGSAPGAIVAFRILLPAALLVLIGLFLVRPLLRRVTDEQVALYLEEHEPSLQAAIISAVEASRMRPGTPSALVQAAGRAAVEKCARARRRPRASSASRCAATPARSRWSRSARSRCSWLGPAYLRHALSALLLLSRSVEAAAPYRIEVTPGNATVPQGRRPDDHRASCSGSTPSRPALMVRQDRRRRRSSGCRSSASDDGKLRGMLFDLAGPLDYFVEADGVQLLDLHAEGRRPAVRPAARARVPLPGLHRPRAAEDRRRRRHRGAARHRGPRQDHADDDDAGRADCCSTSKPPAALTRCRRRHADRQVHRRQGRLLPRRARRADRRARHRVAAVHHRRADRSAADRVDRQAGPRHVARRRSKKCSSRRAPRTTSASGTSSWSTR